jgi:hypothetical protein
MIQTARRWKELGFAGSCLFSTPTVAKSAVHEKEYQRSIAASPPDNWQTVKKKPKELFEEMLQAVLTNEDPESDEPTRTEEDLREIWPFDLEYHQWACTARI